MKVSAVFLIFRGLVSLRLNVIHLILAILLLPLLGAPARAEIRPGSYSVSPFLGGYLFEGNQDLKHRPVFGLRFGYNFTRKWAVEALLDYVPTRYTVTDSNTDVLNYRVEGLYYLRSDRKMVPYLAVGAGGMSIDSRDNVVDKTRAVVDYGAGVKYSLTDRIALRGDVRHILAFGSAYNNLEYTVGVEFSFGGAETISTRMAPETGPAGPPPASQSMSPAPPVSPEPITLTVTPVSDSRIDLVWNAPAGAAGYEIYRDGSRLSSTKAATASDTGLSANTRYCYRVSALDGMNGELSRSNEACATTLMLPPPPPVQRQEAAMPAPAVRPYVLEDIHFDFDKFNLKPEAQAILKRHAAWMIENSDVIITITVEGHCDERGTPEYNLALGERRANAAAKYLIDLGVDAKRVTTISYGFERPIDPSHNEEAWAKNRRAHFAVTEKSGAKK